jgi:hypothetical protein
LAKKDGRKIPPDTAPAPPMSDEAKAAISEEMKTWRHAKPRRVKADRGKRNVIGH